MEKTRIKFPSFFSQFKQIWNELVNSDPSFKMKLFIAGACTLTSLWIGYGYSEQIGIKGWQFWTWLACVIFTIMLFYTNMPGKISKTDLVILFGLVAAALIIRLPFLNWIPGLFHVDEAGVARFARDDLFSNPILVMNPFITGPASQPAMYHYVQYFAMKLFGFSISGARVPSAIIGSLGVAATYLMIKNISGKKVALFSAIVMVFYHFSIQYSRFALNNIWDTLWMPLIIYFFLKGWKDRWYGGAVISGFALGFSQYFYHGSKIVIFILIFLIITRWKENDSLSQKVGFLGIMGIVALCIAGPLLMFSFANPIVFYARVNDDWGWKPYAVQAALGVVDYGAYFWHQILYSLGVYTIYPDPSGFYAPNIPLVIGLSAVSFVTGIVIAFIKRNWMPIVWLLLTSFFGGFLLSVPHSSPHFVVAIPAICWLVGLTINWIWESNHRKMAIILLSSIVLIDLYFYFFIYAYAIPGDFSVPFPPHI
jgi:4-amino-4-deoxy-L-arabinose transferase-like glycosyltransferase